MSRPRRAALLAAAMIACMATLTGCGAYSAQISNQSNRTVYASIFERARNGAMKMLDSTTIGIGSDGSVGPVSPPSDSQAVLIVDATPNPRNVRWIVLRQGSTHFEVTQVNDTPTSPVQVRETK